MKRTKKSIADTIHDLTEHTKDELSSLSDKTNSMKHALLSKFSTVFHDITSLVIEKNIHATFGPKRTFSDISAEFATYLEQQISDLNKLIEKTSKKIHAKTEGLSELLDDVAESLDDFLIPRIDFLTAKVSRLQQQLQSLSPKETSTSTPQLKSPESTKDILNFALLQKDLQDNLKLSTESNSLIDQYFYQLMIFMTTNNSSETLKLLQQLDEMKPSPIIDLFDIQLDDCNTLLHTAITLGNNDIIKILIKHSDLSVLMTHTERSKFAPILHTALMENNTEIANLIITKAAELGTTSLLQLMGQKNKAIHKDLLTTTDETPLFIAIKQQNIAFIRTFCRIATTVCDNDDILSLFDASKVDLTDILEHARQVHYKFLSENALSHKTNTSQDILLLLRDLSFHRGIGKTFLSTTKSYIPSGPEKSHEDLMLDDLSISHNSVNTNLTPRSDISLSPASIDNPDKSATIVRKR